MMFTKHCWENLIMVHIGPVWLSFAWNSKYSVVSFLNTVHHTKILYMTQNIDLIKDYSFYLKHFKYGKHLTEYLDK